MNQFYTEWRHLIKWMKTLPVNHSPCWEAHRLSRERIGVVQCAVRLENSDSTGSSIQPGIVLPGTVMNDATASTRDFAGVPDENTPESAVKWVYVAQHEPQPNVEVLSIMPAPVKKWKSFVAGMCAMLVISIVSVWGWQFLHRPDPLQTQFAASLAPFPVPLTSEQLGILRQRTPSTSVLR